jgi:hypothetical protein
MYAYRTTRTVRLSAGTVLALAAAQAAPRSHLLYAMEPGVYTAKEPLEFKSGETIGLMTPPAKGDSGLDLIGPLKIISDDDFKGYDPDLSDDESDNDDNGVVVLFVDGQLRDPESSTQADQNNHDDETTENPGAASAQSELKEGSAPVQAQASKAEALEPEQPTAAGEAAASDKPQSGNGLDSAQAEESKSGKKAK